MYCLGVQPPKPGGAFAGRNWLTSLRSTVPVKVSELYGKSERAFWHFFIAAQRRATAANVLSVSECVGRSVYESAITRLTATIVGGETFVILTCEQTTANEVVDK